LAERGSQEDAEPHEHQPGNPPRGLPSVASQDVVKPVQFAPWSHAG
jgi:hypothetical protein